MMQTTLMMNNNSTLGYKNFIATMYELYKFCSICPNIKKFRLLLIIKWCYYVNDEVDEKQQLLIHSFNFFFQFIENDIWNFGVTMLGEQWWWRNYHIHILFEMHFKNIMMGRLKLACLKIIYKLFLVSHPYNKTINHFIHHMCSIFKNVMVTNQ
jgi:hypothetical protein